ncbi:hypothetical protein C0991_001194 [Blastosporella zonata]|nr:hypothetical protein C0991_001194 [Blastosporella zonata]
MSRSAPPRRPPSPSQLLLPATQNSLSIPLRFHISNNNLHVHGYQMYAVEKWILERNRPVTVLLVYTGDPAHKISVFALSPLPELSPTEAQAEWDKALQHLRRDGARPKETPHGVLMATSLAHFRSDYTIVLIPDGNFLAVREQLYANINLLRMGCSGRSALTLEDPSDATKSRFISTYHFPDSICAHCPVTSTENLSLTKTRSHSHSQSTSVLNFAKYSPENPSPSLSKSKMPLGLPTEPRPSPSKERNKPDNSVFIATVLELVKLVQAGLALFAMYGPTPKPQVISPPLDGLLCDRTVEGIRRWIVEIGHPCVGLDPMERIADPMFVSALVSLVLCVRNKLAAIGFSQIVPKDPFLHPLHFFSALAAYVQSTSSNPAISLSPFTAHHDPFFMSHHSTSPHTSPHQPHTVPGFGNVAGGTPIFPPYLHHLHPPPGPTQQLTPSSSNSSSSSSGTAVQSYTVLTRELVDAISLAYDGKTGVPRVRRALREKLRAGIDSDRDGDAGGGVEGVGSAIVGGEDQEKEMAGVGTGVASSGGQILSGIGSFASGLGIGVGQGGGSVTGAGAVVEATCDIARLVRAVYSKDGKGKARKGRRRDRREEGESSLLGYGYGGKEKEKDGGVGVSVRALWSGQVNAIAKLREWEIEKGRMSIAGSVAERKRRGESDRYALSDGDVDDSAGALAKSETEEESDAAIQQGSFRGMWGERMQRKLGSWAGLSKRRGNMSLDLTPSTRGENDTALPHIADPLTTARPDMPRNQSIPLSPLLPPVVFSGGDGEQDDDDLLSSGQVSPIDNLRPSPFTLLQDGQSLESTLAHTEYERKVSEFNQKRPLGTRVPQHRISSWADPFSAREFFDDEGSVLDGSSRSRRPRGNTIGSVIGEVSVSSDVALDNWEQLDGNEFEGWFRRKETFGPNRRRSFHDLVSLRRMRIIPVEHMRVDVELAGQLLILTRREQHLQNVISCLEVLTRTLSTTNSLLREDYTSHIPFISELDAHAQVISGIDTENAKADKTSQATNTLRYEAEQFRVPDMWHIATPSRHKVLQLREKVFGTGGRRLPPGVHGAHGKFNRLQWTLDGQERLVDYLGRTEIEAAEEKPGAPYLGTHDEEDEEEVVQHPGIKPMWLLRFFTSWGARWGASSSAAAEPSEKETPNDTSGTNAKGEQENGHSAANKSRKKLAFDLPPETDDESASPVSSS